MKLTSEFEGGSASISEALMKDLATVIAEYKPLRVIETGTYNGLGSTITILKELDKIPNHDYKMHSIEVNPEYYAQALVNLKEWIYAEKLLLLKGLSLERDWPKPKQLEPVPDDIYTDYDNIFDYNMEIAFTGPEGWLDFCFRKTFVSATPLLVFLDSAGHIGYEEFCQALSQINHRNLKDVIIALDDTHHRKHYKSSEYIREHSSQFKILVDSKEKFGHLIAIYNA